MLNTRDGVAEQRIWLRQLAGLLHLEEEEEEKRQHNKQDGVETEEETTPYTRKTRTVWARRWLTIEDMSSDITISY